MIAVVKTPVPGPYSTRYRAWVKSMWLSMALTRKRELGVTEPMVRQSRTKLRKKVARSLAVRLVTLVLPLADR